MKIIDCEQGSREWTDARLGIPTASQFGRILTAKTMKLSSSSTGYMHELLAERILGEPCDSYNSDFMTRGTYEEDEAVKYYEFVNSLKTEKVGFCLSDCGRFGCSPDRLVGEDGGLEIKVPSAKAHVGHLLGSVADEYKAQVQGCLHVTGRQWWDIVSYNPYMPTCIVRCQRDEEFIEKLESALLLFLVNIDEAMIQLKELGVNGDRDNSV